MSEQLNLKRPAHGGNLVWASHLAGCPPAAILDFSASINPLGPPASAIAAIQAELEGLTVYPEPDYSHLRTALSQAHAVPPEWILPGNGSAELLTWASRDLAPFAATYLPVPAFGDYRRALSAFDARVIPVELPLDAPSEAQAWTLALEQMMSQTDRQPDCCGLLLNNPHNPTGHLLTQEAIAPYLERFALVVVDEAFMDFLPPQQQQSLEHWVIEHPNLVILRSLTKFYSLPGLRLGYAIAHPDRLRRWQQWRDPWPVNSLAAAAAIAVLQDTAFQQQTWAWVEPARTQLIEGLSQIPGLQPLPGAANFLLVQSERSVTDLQVDLLRRSRILIRDCLSFPELGDRYFRVAVRTEADNQRLLEGLNAILI